MTIKRYHAFRTRFDLHHKVYQHRVVKALEYMMIDALVPAMTIFTYKGTDGARVVVKDVPRDPVAFTRMNDSIMDLIQNDDTPELEISRQIFEKIEKREMYTSCGRVSHVFLHTPLVWLAGRLSSTSEKKKVALLPILTTFVYFLFFLLLLLIHCTAGEHA